MTSKCTSRGMSRAFWIEPMVWNFWEAGEGIEGSVWGNCQLRITGGSCRLVNTGLWGFIFIFFARMD